MGSPDQDYSPKSNQHFLSSRAIEERVFDYDDFTIYTSDLCSLKRTNWLTDNMIAFATAFLKKEIIHDFTTFEVEVYPPSITEIIKFSDFGEIPILIDKKKFNFFPISDNENPSVACSGK